MNALTNLLDLNQLDLTEFFVNLGEKPFRAKQLLQWIHQRGVQDFSQMTDLSKNLRQRLAEIACIRLPEVVATQLSQDGTRKWLLKLDDDNCIETVFIPEEGRNTLCISSQVGCTLACRFCATGYQGFNRNLSVGEIIAQLWLVEHSLRTEGYPTVSEEEHRVISNVVLMGMGEPLTNFTSVVKAIQLMQDDFAYGLSWRRTTISTAGIVPALLRLKQHCTVGLAISLHAPTDELRNELVPINRKYPLAQLLAACRDYIKEDSRRRITFEYVMLHNINDSPAHAKLLIKLLQGIPSKINLIPFNPFPNSTYQCSSLEAIEEFRNILMAANLMTITRKTRGRDIDAACGQLAGKVQDRTRRTAVRQLETEVSIHGSATHL